MVDLRSAEEMDPTEVARLWRERVGEIAGTKKLEIMGAQNAWTMQGKDVNMMLKQTFGMTAADYSNISAYWMAKMQTDMSLAMRMTELMQMGQAKYS